MESYEIISLLFESVMLIFLLYDNTLSVSLFRFTVPALIYIFINIMLNYLNIPILIKILVVVLITVFALIILKMITFKKAIILCTTFVFCLSICDIIAMEICDILYLFIEINYRNLLLISDLTLTYVICMLTRKILGKNLDKLHIKNTIPLYLTISVDILFVVITGSIITIIQPETQYLLFVITLIVYILILFNLILLMYFVHCKEIEYSNNINLSKMESDYKYYKGKMEDNLRLQELLHDFKNHLLILKSEIQNDQKIDYIDTIEKSFSFYENRYDTENIYLNIILNEKVLLAQEKNILFDIQMTYTSFQNFTPEDICSLFGNAIDNAIEACEKIPIENRRFIKIRICRKGNFILIVFSNSSPNLTLDINTKKRDTLLHGHGLNNIRKCIFKYNGTMQITNSNNVFNLFILIPNQGR